MATKYYAVRNGRRTGVFSTWAECQKQVTGFSGAVFKSFTTIEEAEAFVKGDAAVPAVAMGKKHEAIIDETKLDGGERLRKIFDEESEALVAYVDGSYNVADGSFSYGMVLIHGTIEQSFCQRFEDEELATMRNVAGEIKGAEAAMRYAVAHGFSKLYIYHDYEGIAKWCQGEWKANKDGTKAYKAYYDSICDILQVVFVKVAAHTGDKYNEMADKLAKQALGIL